MNKAGKKVAYLQKMVARRLVVQSDGSKGWIIKMVSKPEDHSSNWGEEGLGFPWRWRREGPHTIYSDGTKVWE
jgi:hypothetical protein